MLESIPMSEETEATASSCGSSGHAVSQSAERVPAVPDPIVELRGISRRFGGVQALDGVGLMLRRGEVLGLLGENGAGKSTLVKILTGVLQPDAGTILIEGNERDSATHR